MFQHVSRASRGARPYQEDACLTWQSPDEAAGLLLVLADGMGGHAGGALASRLVCETFVKSFPTAEGSDTQRLLEGLGLANAIIAETVAHQPSLAGMGSTLVAVLATAAGLQWVSVGDSPLYLWRAGEIALLNEDHSLAPALDKLAEEGRISWTEARNDPRRHMLRSAVTGEELDLVDVSRAPLELLAGDYVILASDGIHTIDTDEIARVVLGYASDGPDAIAQALIRAVENQKDPYQDNITVMVMRPVDQAAP